MATKRTMKKSRKKQPAKKRGRPSKFTPALAKRILDDLSKGTPLTIICESNGMPSDDTVRNWAKADPGFSEDIARAREAGFDRIALDALAIADGSDRDTIAFERAGQMVEIPDKEWILRTKLRVETRLKLLAKWDPKRYGEKLTQEISGPDGGPLESVLSITPEIEDRIKRLASVRADMSPPQGYENKDKS